MVDEAWAATLPRKRVGAGLLLTDHDQRILVVEPTYKANGELPGGLVEIGEAPRAAVAREVREELGVDLPIGRLLVVDWSPDRPHVRDGVMFVYDGGTVGSDVAERFRLATAELRSVRFVAGDELDRVTSPLIARRVRAALDARRAPGTVELQDGRAVDGTSGSPDHVLVVNGTVGSGKTTVVDEIAGVLRRADVPHAAVDRDWLCTSWPHPPGDRFNEATFLRNLRLVWSTAAASGARHLVVAGVLESHRDRDRYEAALPGARLTVCRLRAPLDERRRRIARREFGPSLEWHLHRTGELEAILDAAGVDDVEVENMGDPTAVAHAVLAAAGWPH